MSSVEDTIIFVNWKVSRDDGTWSYKMKDTSLNKKEALELIEKYKGHAVNE